MAPITTHERFVILQPIKGTFFASQIIIFHLHSDMALYVHCRWCENTIANLYIINRKDPMKHRYIIHEFFCHTFSKTSKCHFAMWKYFRFMQRVSCHCNQTRLYKINCKYDYFREASYHGTVDSQKKEKCFTHCKLSILSTVSGSGNMLCECYQLWLIFGRTRL